MGSVLFRIRLLKRLYAALTCLERLGFYSIGCRRPAQDVSPAIAALPERRVVAEQTDSHSKHRKEKPRLIDASGYVDARAARCDSGPAGELPSNFLNDLRLPGVRNNFLAALCHTAMPVSAWWCGKRWPRRQPKPRSTREWRSHPRAYAVLSCCCIWFRPNTREARPGCGS